MKSCMASNMLTVASLHTVSALSLLKSNEDRLRGTRRAGRDPVYEGDKYSVLQKSPLFVRACLYIFLERSWAWLTSTA